MNPILNLGLIGFPLGHSLSPVLHQTALDDSGLSGNYRLFAVPPLPDGEVQLEGLIQALRSGEIQGLNVTIPHKQNVIRYSDRLSPTAQVIGAVNTLSVEAGELVGHNTDVIGFRQDLARVFSLTPGRALVLGAGGSARAVVHALTLDGWEIAVAARRRDQAEALAADSEGNPLEILAFPLRLDEVLGWQPALIANTTPLGMAPHPDASPWPGDLPFPPGASVYDLVYNPAETKFLREARRQGVQTAGGTGMLIEQAALAFEIWTGHSPSRLKMAAALKNYLAMRN